VNSSWLLGWAWASSCLKKRGLDSFNLKMEAVNCWVGNDALWVVTATVNLSERRCHVERGRLLSRLRICSHICTANYVMLTAMSQVWWNSGKGGTVGVLQCLLFSGGFIWRKLYDVSVGWVCSVWMLAVLSSRCQSGVGDCVRECRLCSVEEDLCKICSVLGKF
jgi:hypothetical protein